MIRETDPALIQKYNDICDRGNEQMRKIPLPLPLRFLCRGGLFTAAVFLLSLLRAAWQEEGSFASLYQSVPHFFWLGAVGLLLWAGLSLAARRRENAILRGEENTRIRRQLDESKAEILRHLQVPDDAARADLLAFAYTVKNGTVRPASLGMFTPIDCRIFSREDGLYVATLQRLYRIPANRLCPIRTVKKRIALTSWNKDTLPGADKSSAEKVWVDTLGRIWTKSYGILEWEQDGERWEILVPGYDQNRLTGLPTE